MDSPEGEEMMTSQSSAPSLAELKLQMEQLKNFDPKEVERVIVSQIEQVEQNVPVEIPEPVP